MEHKTNQSQYVIYRPESLSCAQRNDDNKMIATGDMKPACATNHCVIPLRRKAVTLQNTHRLYRRRSCRRSRPLSRICRAETRSTCCCCVSRFHSELLSARPATRRFQTADLHAPKQYVVFIYLLYHKEMEMTLIRLIRVKSLNRPIKTNYM